MRQREIPRAPLHVLPFAFCQASQLWYSHCSAHGSHSDGPHAWTEEETGRLSECSSESSRTGMSKSSPSIYRQRHSASSLCLCWVIGHHLASFYVLVTLPPRSDTPRPGCVGADYQRSAHGPNSGRPDGQLQKGLLVASVHGHGSLSPLMAGLYTCTVHNHPGRPTPNTSPFFKK